MIKKVSQNKCFKGVQYAFEHDSAKTACQMRFGLYLPEVANHTKVPVLFWLSGLTCTHENFIIKSGAQRVASELGIALVAPDTSPREVNIPGEDESYDFGSGAGFYVDATQAPWSQHYHMYSYISKELPALIQSEFPVDKSKFGIFGHSMGGHGALSIAFKNPNLYKTVSAFSPICAPSQCPWGQKALFGYLGDNPSDWQDYDSTALIESKGWTGPELLLDFGSQDEFLKEQLKPELFNQACQRAKVPLNLRTHEGYDHSYFFISSFIEEHLRFHAKVLS